MALIGGKVPEWAFVLYQVAGVPLWHQRLVLGRVASSETDVRREFLIVSPDGDVYLEAYDERNGDISAVRSSDRRWPPPVGLDRNQCYRFPTEPSQARRDTWLAAGLPEAEAKYRARRAAEGDIVAAGIGVVCLDLAGAVPVVVGGVAPEPGGVLVERGAPPGPAGVGPAAGEGPGAEAARTISPLQPGEWRVSAAEKGYDIGTIVPRHLIPSWGTRCHLMKVIVDMGSNVSVFAEFVDEELYPAWRARRDPLDARIMRIRTRHEKRHRDWKDISDDTTTEEFKDWPVKGPRTAAWCVDFLTKQVGGAEDHHLLWKTQAKLNSSDWGVGEHELLMSMVKLAAEYDQLDLGNSACMEVAFKRAQTIEFAYQERIREQQQMGGKGSRLTYEEQAVFLGVTRSDVIMICPKMLDYVREEVQRDSELAKNLRKAREERDYLRKGKGDNQNDRQKQKKGGKDEDP
jgi:hypothetical protein